MLLDRPIATSKEDRFGRKQFVETLSRALRLPRGSAGMVIALEGVWGSGKTSILNLIEQALKRKRTNTIVIRFNPWLFSGLESLCGAFLLQFAAAIGKTASTDAAQRTAGTLLKLAKFITPIKLIPGIEPWGTAVEAALTSIGNSAQASAEITALDLNDRKLDVANSLRELDQPVVVIIDDIDRLLPDEIRLIFQLVKSVVDFERVTYLLAYDHEAVVKALAIADIPDGESYLEKIVQLSYPVPQLSYWELKTFLASAIGDFVRLYRIKLRDFESQRLQQSLSEGVTHAIRHPRDVIRLVNRVRISSVATRGEVNFADVLAFEALSLRFPDVAEVVRKRPHDVIDTSRHGPEQLASDFSLFYDETVEKEQGRLPAWKNQLWKDRPDLEKSTLGALLDFLFPGFRSPDHSDRAGIAEAQLRISAPGPLLKLLAVGHVDGVPSARQASQFLEDPDARAEMLNALIGTEDIEPFLEEAEYHLRQVVASDSQALPELLSSSVMREYGKTGRSIVNSAGDFLLALTAACPEESNKTELLWRIANSPTCLSLGHHVVRQVVAEHGRWAMNPGSEVSEEDRTIRDWSSVERAKNAWITQVETKAASPELLFQEPELLKILFRWGQLKGDNYAAAQHFVEEATRTHVGLEHMMRRLGPGIGLDGIQHLMQPRLTLERINAHPKRDTFRVEISQYLAARVSESTESNAQ